MRKTVCIANALMTIESALETGERFTLRRADGSALTVTRNENGSATYRERIPVSDNTTLKRTCTMTA